jgi:spermidine synthase
MARDRRIFVACYTASGGAALLYQVVWTRLFSLQLGHTTAASSTVLAAFMGGLAAGAWIGGRIRIDSSRGLLTLYAAIELFIGAIAIVLPGALNGAVPMLAWAYADGTTPTFFAVFRVSLSLLLVGVPAAAMGATFPVAVAWLAPMDHASASSRRNVPATAAGILYAANTMGAAMGAIGAGFWLIPATGLRTTTWIGVTLNIAAAAGAFWLGRRPQARPASEQPKRATRTKPGREQRRKVAARAERSVSVAPRPVLAAAAAGLSGFIGLVYEVAWTRLLALVLGPTTYAFAIMAASFITGIAIGSLVATWLARRITNPALWLGGTLVLTIVSAPVAAWFAASRLPMFVAAQVNAGAAFDAILYQQVLAVAGVLLPTSIALGASFVLAVATATGDNIHVARQAAHVYVANTIGAVIGALSAGFLLIPRIGLQSTFVAISVAGACGGVLVMMLGVPRRSNRALLGMAATATAVAAVFAVLPDWDRQLLASGAYKYSRGLDAEVLDATLRAGQLEYYKEGAAGTVSVRRLAGSRSLAIDGKVDASNAGDMLTQRLLGVLPVLLHPAPRDALVIGLGSGVTADAVLASGEIQRLDVVEISPQVVEASTFFERENRRVLNNPAVRLLIADGRSHLRLSAHQYDVIVSEPSNPWMAGVAALFTREFFQAAHARLRPDGVFCQWTHTYEIAEEDLRSIVHTFASVFPNGTMWLVGEGDLLLIGSPSSPIESRLRQIEDRSRKGAVPKLLADVGVLPASAPFVLLSLFTGGAEQLARFGDRAPVQSDDRMALEFSAGQAMFAPPEGSAARLEALAADEAAPAVVTEIMRSAGATDWAARGNAALQAKASGTAYDSFRRSLELDGRSPPTLRGLTDAAAGAGHLHEAAEWLETRAAAEPDNAAVRVELSHALAMLGSTEDAIASAQDAARIDPQRPEPLEQLASVLADAGDARRLISVADDLTRRFPARQDGYYYQAAALFLEGRTRDAERPLRTLFQINRDHAKGQNLLGAMCASVGNEQCASSALAAALQLDPRDSSIYVNLGYLRVARGDPRGAAAFFAEALAIDPASEPARRGLAEARAARD